MFLTLLARALLTQHFHSDRLLATVLRQLKKAEGKGVRKILEGLVKTQRRPIKKRSK